MEPAVKRVKLEVPQPFPREIWLQIEGVVDRHTRKALWDVCHFFRTFSNPFVCRCNLRQKPLDQNLLGELCYWPYLQTVDLRCRLVNVLFIRGLQICPTIERLVLNGCEGVDGEVVLAISQGCPLLKCLELNRTGVPGDQLVELVERLVQLERLSMVDCLKVTTSHLGKIMKRRPVLQFSLVVGVYLQNREADKIRFEYVELSQIE